MEPTIPHSVQQLYPIRYWMAVAYAVGVPNFIHFDPTGLTHNYGLFNLTSLSTITVTLSIVFLLLTITALTRHRLISRRVDIFIGLWIGLFVTLSTASLMQPASRLVPYSITDIPLSLYRLFEWLLAFYLFLSVYSRALTNEATHLAIGIIVRACWINIAIVWLVLPFASSLAYCSEDAAPGSAPRLGGVVIHPGDLALLSSIVFFHTLLFFGGWHRIFGCGLALLTLSLTYGRGAQIVFLISLFVYLIFLSKKTALQWVSIGLLLATAGSGLMFQDNLVKYISRGQSVSDVSSLSDRTVVWQASLSAITQRPLLGYGFIIGARNALRDQWHSTHWIPPHAHNEYLQAMLSGGAVALAIVVVLYFQLILFACRGARSGRQGTFLFLVFFQLISLSFVATILSTQFNRVGALFLLCFIGVVAPARDRPPARKRLVLRHLVPFGGTDSRNLTPWQHTGRP
jgi:O-antigen ligase